MTDRTLSPIDAVDLVALDRPRRFGASEFDLTRLCELKATATVSVCVPARDEAETVGPIVQTIATLRHRGLVDEIVVMGDRSTDATARLAAATGARVISVPDVLPEAGTATGKGNVLWASVAASTGDVIVWIDADLRSLTPEYVIGLLGPLQPTRGHPRQGLLRPPHGRWRRRAHDRTDGSPRARHLFPELGVIEQPLGGEFASRRSILEQLPFQQGCGVETGLLIDIAHR